MHGVFFRASMARLAKEQDVSGWVRNLADGSVEALLEGEEESVAEVVDWARRGPPAARVDSIQVAEVKTGNVKGFRIEG